MAYYLDIEVEISVYHLVTSDHNLFHQIEYPLISVKAIDSSRNVRPIAGDGHGTNAL